MCASAVVAAACAAAGASTLNVNMTADDMFNLYISTDDSQRGTLVGSADDWSMVRQYTVDLTPGVRQYIHVEAADLWGCIAAFMGDFTLSDNSFTFANGSARLVTDSANWRISNVGFGQGYYAPDEIDVNGAWPWGYIDGIASDAKWIWSNGGYDIADWDNWDWENPDFMPAPVTRYFSAEIVPVGQSVPEPMTMCVLAAGGALVCGRRAKRRAA
jgi:hypothetical protein